MTPCSLPLLCGEGRRSYLDFTAGDQLGICADRNHRGRVDGSTDGRAGQCAILNKNRTLSARRCGIRIEPRKALGDLARGSGSVSGCRAPSVKLPSLTHIPLKPLERAQRNPINSFHVDLLRRKRPGCSQALADTAEFFEARSPRPETYAWSWTRCRTDRTGSRRSEPLCR
jgi:hypothetical protein